MNATTPLPAGVTAAVPDDPMDGARARESAPQRLRLVAGHDLVTASMRRLEPWIAGTIALYTAWIALLALPGAPLLWAFVGYAALMALAVHRYPARCQSAMFIHGLALVTGAGLLAALLQPTGDLFFFWLAITTLYYAFMLQPVWALGLVALAMVTVVGAAWVAGPLDWAMLAAPLGFLAVFPPVVAMRFGTAMRRAEEAAERSQTDATTGLYNLHGFLDAGSAALQTCATEGKPASMAVLDCTDLQEVRTIYGRQIGRRVMARLVRKLKAVAGSQGVLARTGPVEFTIVFPGMTRERAQAAMEQVLGRPGIIEYDASDSEIVMVPDVLLEELECGPHGLEEALARQGQRLRQRMQDRAEHERYLTLERERHSRPAPLVSLSSHAPLTPADSTPSLAALPLQRYPSDGNPAIH